MKIDTFENDVKDHQMTIYLDQGVYRHIRFRKKDSLVYHFDIVTYPGYLAISGDMGCFVFARLYDMFDFHTDNEPNFQYWAEKIQAQDKHGGVEEFSKEKFQTNVFQYAQDFLEDSGWESVAKEELLEDIRYDLSLLDDNEYECVNWVDQYVFTYKDEHFGFHDFWEYNNNEYSYNYIWCCYAIIYAIKTYNDSKR